MLSLKTVPVDVSSVLSHALWIEVKVTILELDALLEQAPLLKVVVKAKNFHSIRCICVPLDRRLQLVFVSELAYRSILRV